MDKSINIQRIVNTAGNLDKVSEGLTVSIVSSNEDGDPVKIRAYATEEEALEKENLLDQLREKIDIPEFFGRWRNYLVFRYLDLDQGDSSVNIHESYFSIGRFLGSINKIKVDEIGAEALQHEFSNWLDRLSRMRLIPSWVKGDAIAYYQQNKPQNLPICIDYWDAMPHNFGWTDGDFYLLDEKHLRPSYQGIGLIKPLYLLQEEEWQRVKEGYTSVSSTYQGIDDNLGFLKFYYLVAALYFYSLISAAGRISLGKNLRFLDYRDRLISTVSSWSIVTKLRSDVNLYRTYPLDVPYLFWRRVSPTKSQTRVT